MPILLWHALLLLLGNFYFLSSPTVGLLSPLAPVEETESAVVSLRIEIVVAMEAARKVVDQSDWIEGVFCGSFAGTISESITWIFPVRPTISVLRVWCISSKNVQLRMWPAKAISGIILWDLLQTLLILSYNPRQISQVFCWKSKHAKMKLTWCSCWCEAPHACSRKCFCSLDRQQKLKKQDKHVYILLRRSTDTIMVFQDCISAILEIIRRL